MLCHRASNLIVYLVVSLVIAPSVLANTATATTNQVGTAPTEGATATPQVINNGNGTREVVQTVYCPPPSQLVKSGLYWRTATDGWKSYSESFDQKITSFIGAQWVGVNVGRMICIYKGNLTMSFTIPVQNDTLAETPKGGLWGQDLGGYRNCHSTNIQDCPFVVKTQKINIQQIYRSLDFFKGKPNPLNQDGT